MRFDIRREAEEDFRAVEELTREAFWNLNSPGCEEHYLVHILRSHADFLPELDLVATHGAEIAASILYSRSRVEDVPTVTFGPLSVLPAYQRMGAGSALVRHTLSLCRERESAPSSFTATRPITPVRLSPGGGVRHLHRRRHVRRRPASAGTVARFHGGRAWPLFESPAFEVDVRAAEAFDKDFPRRPKRETPTQRHFQALAAMRRPRLRR